MPAQRRRGFLSRLFGGHTPEETPEPRRNAGPVSNTQIEESIPAGVRIAGAWSWRMLLIIAVLAVVVLIIAQLRLIVIPLFIALLLTTLLQPAVVLLTRWRVPRGLAIAIAILGTLAVVSGLIMLVSQQIANGFDDVRQRTVASYDDLKQFLLESPLHLTEAQINDFVDEWVSALVADSNVLLSGALSVGSTLGHLGTSVLLTLFCLLFMLIDGRGIWRWVVSLFPRRARLAVDGAGVAGWSTLSNYVRTQILVASIDAVGIGLGAFFLGLPLAIPIAVVVFLGAFVPIVGAVTTGALAVFIALVYNGWQSAIIMLIIVLAVQQIEGHVLQPLLMGTAVKVHPLAVVLVVTAGTILAGIPGALFAVPVTAGINVMIKYISSGAWRRNADPEAFALSDSIWQRVPQQVRIGRQTTPTPEGDA
ncbi:AI-2E family transporter [Mycetocola reblochoni]|uniref:AI-2E family transporter n=1 Tax=Mycetocola reblochoni TaxID=331618 RepID=A0A3L6ZHW2_9MICO|nr:AI-2E family transporter [Mycetocola reblochoni]RLP67588.1 AI-2E family transporter [Mycetocola reblochoni]